MQWCPACNWNVDPSPPAPPEGWVARRARQRAQVRGAALYRQISRGLKLRPRWDRSRVATVVAAVAVHLSTAVVGVAAVVVAVATWPSPIGLFVAAGLAAMTWTVRPRFGRLAKSAKPLRRADLPVLFAVLDRTVASIGGRSPDLVFIDSVINASWGIFGWRRRRILTIGRPLWAAASPPQQVALLGHELAHEINGDVTHGLIVGSAVQTLSSWRTLLIDGGRQVRPRYRRNRLIDELARLVLIVLGAIPLLIQRLVEGARDRTTQRAEYLADEFAARAGGDVAAAGMMELLLLHESISLTLQRAANERVTDRIEFLRSHLSDLPALEVERLRRVAEQRGHRVDATHPPTHLRLAFLRSLQPIDPSVTMTPDEAAAVDAEVLGAVSSPPVPRRQS